MQIDFYKFKFKCFFFGHSWHNFKTVTLTTKNDIKMFVNKLSLPYDEKIKNVFRCCFMCIECKEQKIHNLFDFMED
jgi:hypothetical protein